MPDTKKPDGPNFEFIARVQGRAWERQGFDSLRLIGRHAPSFPGTRVSQLRIAAALLEGAAEAAAE